MFKAQAVILAGGRGARLRPYTTVLPKPLVPVGGIPIAEVIIRQLKSHGIKNIVMATGYLAELIEAYFGDGSRFGVRIEYLKEKNPLGTAGALKLITNLDENFLVINGDTLINFNFKEFLSFHKVSKNMATITIKGITVKTDFGVIKSDGKGAFLDYIEKPSHRSYVSVGINAFNRGCQNHITRNKRVDIPELMLKLKNLGEKVSCYKTKNIWLDLGRLDDLELAQRVFSKNKRKFL
jgi:NDP-sugar pyrophosphorylase family protein